MKPINHIRPLVTQIANNKVTLDKKAFEALVQHINTLTDTVNELTEHQHVSEENIKTLAKSIEIIGG